MLHSKVSESNKKAAKQLAIARQAESELDKVLDAESVEVDKALFTKSVDYAFFVLPPLVYNPEDPCTIVANALISPELYKSTFVKLDEREKSVRANCVDDELKQLLYELDSDGLTSQLMVVQRFDLLLMKHHREVHLWNQSFGKRVSDLSPPFAWNPCLASPILQRSAHFYLPDNRLVYLSVKPFSGDTYELSLHSSDSEDMISFKEAGLVIESLNPNFAGLRSGYYRLNLDKDSSSVKFKSGQSSVAASPSSIIGLLVSKK